MPALPWNYLPFRMSNYKWHLRELDSPPSQKTTKSAPPTLYPLPSTHQCLLSAVCAAQMRTNRLSGVWRVADQGPNRSSKFAKPHTMRKLHPTWWQTTPTIWTPDPALTNIMPNGDMNVVKKMKGTEWKARQWDRRGARAVFDVKCSFSHCEDHWKVFRAGRT